MVVVERSVAVHGGDELMRFSRMPGRRVDVAVPMPVPMCTPMLVEQRKHEPQQHGDERHRRRSPRSTAGGKHGASMVGRARRRAIPAAVASNPDCGRHSAE